MSTYEPLLVLKRHQSFRRNVMPFYEQSWFNAQLHSYTTSLTLFYFPSWSWSYTSWIDSYLWNHCPSPLMLWVQIPLMTKCTRYNLMW